MMKQTSVTLFTLVLIASCDGTNGLGAGSHTGGQPGTGVGGAGGTSAAGTGGAGDQAGGSGGSSICPPCALIDCPYGEEPVVGCGCVQCALPPK